MICCLFCFSNIEKQKNLSYLLKSEVWILEGGYNGRKVREKHERGERESGKRETVKCLSAVSRLVYETIEKSRKCLYHALVSSIYDSF